MNLMLFTVNQMYLKHQLTMVAKKIEIPNNYCPSPTLFSLQNDARADIKMIDTALGVVQIRFIKNFKLCYKCIWS